MCHSVTRTSLENISQESPPSHEDSAKQRSTSISHITTAREPPSVKQWGHNIQHVRAKHSTAWFLLNSRQLYITAAVWNHQKYALLLRNTMQWNVSKQQTNTMLKMRNTSIAKKLVVTYLWRIDFSTFFIKNLDMYVVHAACLQHPASSRSNHKLCTTVEQCHKKYLCKNVECNKWMLPKILNVHT